MSGALGQRAVPQCTACLRSYAFPSYADAAAPASALGQQIRGKKKLANNSATMPVRLLKDVKTFGRKGALVPISRGWMRNNWFPNRIAAYISAPEIKTLHLNNTAIERSFDFGLDDATSRRRAETPKTDTPELRRASAFQKETVVEKLSPERSAELIQVFVPSKLHFFRQPVMEDEDSKAREAAEAARRQRIGGGAAADLLAARRPKLELRRPIYGSVSTADVAAAVRSWLQATDEANRVVVHDGDVHFTGLTEDEGADVGRVKVLGEFKVEISIKGLDMPVQRMVKVNAQEA